MSAGAWDLQADMVRSITDDGSADPVRGRVVWDPVHSLWNGAMLLAALVLGPPTFSLGALAVFAVTTGATLLLGHSVGFHRRLIHQSFDCPKWLEHALAWVGTLVGMSGPFWMIRTHDLRDWAQRRADCHPYLSHRSPMLRDAVWQMHCRLVLAAPPRLDLPAGIGDDRFYRWLERTWMLQQAPVAILLYALGGWGWVVWGVCARVAISVIGHWFVGHLAHTRGPQTWLVHEAGVQAHDVPWAAIPTMGEAWHNNHHAYPGSARIGLYPGQFDPGFRFIQLLGLMGLAWNVRTPDLSAGNARLRSASQASIERILCVDHSGERGAIGIYRAQLLVARLRSPELLGFLRETLQHERDHMARFLDLMRSRDLKPCPSGGLWVLGGAVLGLVTGLLGRQAVLICTEAVERTVHRHLLEQVEATAEADPEVSRAIADILKEEAGHLAYARTRRAPAGKLDLWLDRLIAGVTEGLIRLSVGSPARARRPQGYRFTFCGLDAPARVRH